MTRLISAELLKLRTARANLVFYAVAAVLAVFGVAIQLVASTTGDLEPLSELSRQYDVMTGGGQLVMIATFFGALGLSGELRHGTLVPALLITPRRSRVLAAKGVAHLVAGAAMGLLIAATTAVAGAVVIIASGETVAVAAGEVLTAAGGTVLAGALGALFGLGIGTLARNQALAIGAVAVVLLVLEPLVAALFSDLASWMPGSLTNTVAGWDVDGAPSALTAATTFAGYGLVLTALGGAVLARTDV